MYWLLLSFSHQGHDHSIQMMQQSQFRSNNNENLLISTRPSQMIMTFFPLCLNNLRMQLVIQEGVFTWNKHEFQPS